MATFFLRKLFRWHVLAWLAFAAYSLLSFLVLHCYFKEPVSHGISIAKGLWLAGSFLVARIAPFTSAICWCIRTCYGWAGCRCFCWGY